MPAAQPTERALFWPVENDDASAREVAYRDSGGTEHGRPGRRFLAVRSGGQRYHVAIDLWGNEGDRIVAVEDGVVVNRYPFYEGVDALIVQCDSGLVINYGEVGHLSWEEFGLDVGSRVEAGKPIARVGRMNSGSSMCHFEAYSRGTTENRRWMVGKQRPAELLDPTAYLLHLSRHGR